MKKKRFEEGGYVDDSDLSDEVDRQTSATGITVSDDYLSKPKKSAAPKKTPSRSAEPKPVAETKRERTRANTFRELRGQRPTVRASGFAKGGGIGSASRRGDGIAKRGKTKGRFV